MEWIKTENRLPKVGETILVLDSSTQTPYLVFLCNDSNDICWTFTDKLFGDGLDFCAVTHWMPLPPLPETTE